MRMKARTGSPAAPVDLIAAATGPEALAAAEPDWWTPNDAYLIEAEQLAEMHGVEPAVGLRLLKQPDKTPDFRNAMAFWRPTRRQVLSPERTVPGMAAAGQRLAEAIKEGEKIAVFGDYDCDGTTAVAALTLALRPYLSVRCDRCGGRKGADCFDCHSTGQVFQSDRLHLGFADAQRGFGLTDEFVRQAHAAGATVLVTLDCGSSQIRQVELAQSLGMQVIVVDHHSVEPGNPAEHHLNPKLQGEDCSPNTGAVLAWKLGAATQIAMSGRTRREHWQQAMFLAGLGCRADMGSVTDPEHRAFFWVPLDDESADPIPPGLRLLATELGEDPRTPSGGVLTSAAMNLPKRSRLVDASDVGAILLARSEAEARPLVDKLVAAYEVAKPIRKEMVGLATEQIAAQPEADRVGVAVLDGYEDYAGYTGAISSAAARSAGKPVITFASKGEDEFGRETYKFSIRSERKTRAKVGELIEDEGMRAACSLERLNEAGETEIAPSIGGHPEVVSGSCYADKIAEVTSAVQTWAGSFKPYDWFPDEYRGAEAYLTARDVSPERFLEIERQARRLAPFSRLERHRPVTVSVRGAVADAALDEETGYVKATLRIAEDLERTIVVPPDRAAELPEGEAEFVMDLGEDRDLFVRLWHVRRPVAEAA